MYIKKILLLIIIILFFPLLVMAENCDANCISIKSIALNDKSANVVELEKASVNGRNIILNIRASEVGDNISYKVIVTNSSNDDYELDKNSFTINSDYIDYSFEFEDDSGIVKANSSKTIYINIKYQNPVPEQTLASGPFTDSKKMIINLQTDNSVDNPNTNVQSWILIASLGLILGGTICILLINKKYTSFIILVISMTVIVPTIIYALCKTEITIESNVIISKGNLLSFNFDCNPDEKLQYYEGMTFADWLKSGFYTGTIKGEYETQEACEKVWGKNHGCALLEQPKAYAESKETYNYDDLEECEDNWGTGNCHNNGNTYYYEDSYIDTYDSMEECEADNYSGCKTLDKVYSYQETKKYFYTSLNECKLYWDEECELVENVYGHVSTALGRSTSYSSSNECEAEYGIDTCYAITNDNDSTEYKKHKLFYYETLEECSNKESNYSSMPSLCERKEKAYVHRSTTYHNYITLNECLSESNGLECNERLSKFYYPTRVNIDEYRILLMEETNEIYYYSPNYQNGVEYWRYLPLNMKIENRTYACSNRPIAECVSPESAILSINNKTIKAKNIKENDPIAYFDFATNKVMIGKVGKVYIHKDVTELIRYTFEDNSYLEATDYHPIYTKEGWKSYTNRNGYSKPVIGDMVKTKDGYKKLIKIEVYNGKEDYYDFQVLSTKGKIVNNYYANGILVQASIE